MGPLSHDPALAISVSRVERSHDLAGSVFCPRCGFKIGRAESPAIGYVKRCSGCDRAIAIEREGDILRISVGDDIAQH